MVRIIIILFYIIIVGCNNSKSSIVNPEEEKSSQKSFIWPDSILTKKMRDTLRTLPFIQKADKYFDSLSNHKHGVTFVADTFKGNIHMIAVYYEDNHFKNLYRFEVNPNTMKINIADIDSRKYITLDEYYKLNPSDK